MEFLGESITSFNVEATNKCVLKCSACDRTLRPEIIKKLEDLSPKVFHKILFEDLRHADLNNTLFNFCGIYGDNLYHKEIFTIFRLIKKRGCRIHLETNGSYKTEKWWNELFSILTRNDKITFSVDGMEDTNVIYRENSDWESINLGMKLAGESNVLSTWKFIIFKHNQHQIEDAKKHASKLGITRFLTRNSGRFLGMDDPLRPDESHIGLQQIHREHVQKYMDTDKWDEEVSILPRCQQIPRKNIGLTYEGYIIPCLTFHSVHNEWFEKNKQRFDIKGRNILDVLADPIWEELHALWDTPSLAPRICNTYCGTPRNKKNNTDRIKSQDYKYESLLNKREWNPFLD